MSFASAAKEELLRIKVSHEGCLIAELSALAQVSGSLVLKKDGCSFTFTVEHGGIARRIYELYKQLTGDTAELHVKENGRMGRHRTYLVTIPQSQAQEALRRLELLQVHRPLWRGVPNAASRICCQRAFLRGIFLACGSASDPEKENHLELVCKNMDLAVATGVLLTKLQLKNRVFVRKGDAVVYLKDAESIGDFFTMIGAHRAILAQENVRIKKQVRNEVNRRVNCETANLTKTVDAAVRQCAAIRYLMEKEVFLSLPEELVTIGALRLQNPEASNADLAVMVGDVTRSGVNHRLRKLLQAAKECGFTES